MALSYEFLLNGETLNATIGAMVYDKLEEALDEAAFHLPITTFEFPKKILGLLEITVSDSQLQKKFNLLIISDEVSDSSKDGFYEHNLIAIEYTHKLDKHFVSALTFTQPFVRNARAPFEFFIEGGPEVPSPGVKEIVPRVVVNETYRFGDVINIPITDQSIVAVLGGNELRDTHIETNLDGYNSTYNISTGTLSLTIPENEGFFYLDVGYIHQSSFVKKFRHYFRVITNLGYSLYDMINRVRAIIPIERESIFEQTRIFEIEPSLVDLFKSIEMPQMFFKQQTARQVLNTMFKYINAISRLKYGTQNDLLSVDFFNKIQGQFDSEDITSFQMAQNAQDYGTKAISFLSQTLQTNFRDNPSVITPANNLFKTLRSKNVQLTDSNFELKLEKPIYELYKVEVMLPKVKFKAETPSGLVEVVKNNFVLDVTSRFIEKSLWDLKSKTVDIFSYPEINPFAFNIGLRENQGGNIPWVKNSKSIELAILFGNFIKETLLVEVIQEALNEEMTLRLTEDNIMGNEINGSDLTLLPSADYRYYLSTEENAYRNISFNIEYSTLDDTVIRQERLDTEFVSYNSEVRVNNFQTVSDFGRVSRDLYGKIERSGIPNKTISKIHTSLSDVLEVGQIDNDNYIITERKLIFHNEFIEAVYTLTRNHNRLNEFNGINQEYRAFEIPSFNETVKRLDFYSDYIYIVNPEQRGKIPYNETDTTIFDFRNKFFEPFKHLDSSAFEDFQTKITYAFVRTDGFLKTLPDINDEYKAIITPVVSFGGKNNLNFNFKFDNNQVAGDAITPASVDGGILNTLKITNYYNNPIRYTDDQGYFDKLWFGMSSRYEDTGNFNNIADVSEEYFNEGYAYPLVKGTQESLQQDFQIKNNDFFNPDWFLIFKDAATNYGFSYQLNIIPLDYRAFIVGQNFYTENPLVMNHSNIIKKYLYVYENGTKYNIFDDLKVKSGYAASVEITGYNMIKNDVTYTIDFVNNAEFALEDATSWAIGDADGNLYLACNEPYKGFGLISRHKRLNVFDIGQKISSQLTEINDFITSDMIIGGFLPEFNQDSITDVLSSDMNIIGKGQQIFETSLNQMLYSNIFLRGEAQTTYNVTKNEILDSLMVLEGVAQTNYNTNITDMLQSELLVKGSAQITIGSVINDALSSEILLDGEAQTTDSTSVNDALTSFILVVGEAQITQSIPIPNQILNSELLAHGIVQVTQSGATQSEILNSELLIGGEPQTTLNGSILTQQLTSDLVIDGSLAYFKTLKAAISVDNDISSASRFLSTTLTYEFNDEGSNTMTLNNQYVSGFPPSSPTYSLVGTKVEGTSYSLSVPSSITNINGQWNFSFWTFVDGGTGNYFNPKEGTLDQDIILLAVYSRIT